MLPTATPSHIAHRPPQLSSKTSPPHHLTPQRSQIRKERNPTQPPKKKKIASKCFLLFSRTTSVNCTPTPFHTPPPPSLTRLHRPVTSTQVAGTGSWEGWPAPAT